MPSPAERRRALAAVSAYLRCPVCAGPLHLGRSRLACGRGHSFDIARHGYVNLTAGRAGPGTADGRYFVAARIRDRLGQQLEDAALVTVGEPGEPDASLPPEELFFRLQSDVQALADEVDLEILTPQVRLAPGESGELAVRVASRLASQLRGELQLISPIGSWQATGPWTQAVDVPPGEDSTRRFAVKSRSGSKRCWYAG